jgi:NADP-dependent 3-hydroxy acid dehydrogenase YdfG
MKTLIITGGATGIGQGIINILEKEKYNIILGYNKSVLEAKKIKEKMQKKGYNIEIFKVNVREKKQIEKLIKFTIE